jgi:hypothetical protein
LHSTCADSNRNRSGLENVLCRLPPDLFLFASVPGTLEQLLYRFAHDLYDMGRDRDRLAQLMGRLSQALFLSEEVLCRLSHDRCRLAP